MFTLLSEMANNPLIDQTTVIKPKKDLEKLSFNMKNSEKLHSNFLKKLKWSLIGLEYTRPF